MKTPKTPVHALKKSIKKYEKLLKKAKVGRMPSSSDIRADNCACCAYARDDHGGIECNKCLIAQHTGRGDCEGTPWVPLFDYLDEHENAYGGPPQDVVCGLLKKEVRFLKTVLSCNTQPGQCTRPHSFYPEAPVLRGRMPSRNDI